MNSPFTPLLTQAQRHSLSKLCRFVKTFLCCFTRAAPKTFFAFRMKKPPSDSKAVFHWRFTIHTKRRESKEEWCEPPVCWVPETGGLPALTAYRDARNRLSPGGRCMENARICNSITRRAGIQFRESAAAGSGEPRGRIWKGKGKMNVIWAYGWDTGLSEIHVPAAGNCNGRRTLLHSCGNPGK